MKTLKKISGVTLAAAAAAMFAAAPIGSAVAGEKEGKCFNINTCKGHGDCATAEAGCTGLNSCAGKGWLKKTKSECDSAGGKFET